MENHKKPLQCEGDGDEKNLSKDGKNDEEEDCVRALADKAFMKYLSVSRPLNHGILPTYITRFFSSSCAYLCT